MSDTVDIADVIAKKILFLHPITKHPVTKRQIFDYLRRHNHDFSLFNDVLYKLYIRTYLSFKKEKTMHKNELKTRKDIEKRLDEWLMREYYRPPNVEGGPGYYETLNNFKNSPFSLWDTERKKEKKDNNDTH